MVRCKPHSNQRWIRLAVITQAHLDRVSRHSFRSLFVTFFLTLLCACEYDGVRAPTRTYIPEGYEGWVRIEYNVANMPELPHEWDLIPLRKWSREQVPISGLLQTSSPYGVGSNSAQQFLFYTDDSSRLIPEEMVWCVFSFHNFQFRQDSGDQKEFVMLFIGKPGHESSQHCAEITKYRTPTFPYFKMERFSDLPATGNLNGATSK